MMRVIKSDSYIKKIFFCLEQTATLHWYIESGSRYTEQQTYSSKVQKQIDFVNEAMDTSPCCRYNAHEFCTHFCMSRGAFYQLWNAIKDHNIFNNGGAKKKQVSSKYQLLIFLKFLGTEGDGMSNQKATAIFPSSTGAFEVIKD